MRGAGAAAAALALFFMGSGPAAAQVTDRLTPVEESRVLVMPVAEGTGGEVSQILPGAAGTLYVAFTHPRRILTLGMDGTVLATFGRGGRDAGQTGLIGQMSWRGDTLVVLDPVFRRMVRYGPDGAHLGDIQFPERPVEAGGASPLFPERLLPDGGLLYLERIPGAAEEDPPLGTAVLLAEGIFARPDTTFLLPAGGPVHTISLRRGEQRAGWDNLYVHTPFHAVAQDGARVLLVERPLAPGPAIGAFWVTQRTAAGDTLFRQRFTYTPEKVEPRIILPLLARAFQPLLGGTEGELLALLQGEVDLPPFEPPVTGAHVGLDGTLWIREWRVPGLPDGWRILTPEGERVGVVELPPGVRFITGTRDFLWAGKVDHAGSHLIRYRLTPE